MIQYIVLFTAPMAYVGILFAIARASADELDKVKSMGVMSATVITCSAMIGWYGFNCVQFALSPESVSRKDIAIFSLQLINVLLAWMLLIVYLGYRSKKSAAAKIQALHQKKEALQEKLLESRERLLLEKSHSYTDEQLNNLLRAMKDQGSR